jgi:hypothetical protein
VSLSQPDPEILSNRVRRIWAMQSSSAPNNVPPTIVWAGWNYSHLQDNMPTGLLQFTIFIHFISGSTITVGQFQDIILRERGGDTLALIDEAYQQPIDFLPITVTAPGAPEYDGEYYSLTWNWDLHDAGLKGVDLDYLGLYLLEAYVQCEGGNSNTWPYLTIGLGSGVTLWISQNRGREEKADGSYENPYISIQDAISDSEEKDIKGTIGNPVVLKLESGTYLTDEASCRKDLIFKEWIKEHA